MRNHADLPDIVSVAQAAEYLYMSPRTLHHWCKTGKVKATKMGEGRTHSWAITRAEVERLAAGAGKAKSA